MTKDSRLSADVYEADPILGELVHYRDLMRKIRAKLKADSQLVAESQKAIEETKKRLTTKLQKL